MIVGVGVDVVEVARLGRSLERTPALMVQLERHALVTLQLRALVRRATSSRRRTA